jgi:hypothetical protein
VREVKERESKREEDIKLNGMLKGKVSVKVKYVWR